jgi:hypothetical protein
MQKKNKSDKTNKDSARPSVEKKRPEVVDYRGRKLSPSLQKAVDRHWDVLHEYGIIQ